MLSLLAALAAGIAIGILVDRTLLLHHGRRAWRSGPPPPRVERWLDRKLDLDDAQRTAVRGILDRRRERFDAIARRNLPEVQALRDSTTAEICALLRPDQREEYDRMIERIEKMRKRGRRGPFEGGRLPY